MWRTGIFGAAILVAGAANAADFVNEAQTGFNWSGFYVGIGGGVGRDGGIELQHASAFDIGVGNVRTGIQQLDEAQRQQRRCEQDRQDSPGDRARVGRRA